MKLVISTRRIVIWLISIALVLNTISAVSKTIEYLAGWEETPEFVRLFYVAEEANITTWYASFLLTFSAILLALISISGKEGSDPPTLRWKILSIIFVIMSIDEVASIHEMATSPVRSLLNTSGIFRYAWVIIAIPIVLIVVAYYFRFVQDLPQDTRILIVIAGGIFVFAAVGLEMMEGLVYTLATRNWVVISGILTIVEEFLENVGIVIFIMALLSYMKLHLKPKGISLDIV
jgi:hypothetical protein